MFEKQIADALEDIKNHVVGTLTLSFSQEDTVPEASKVEYPIQWQKDGTLYRLTHVYQTEYVAPGDEIRYAASKKKYDKFKPLRMVNENNGGTCAVQSIL
jgi:hypothetical protein